MSTSRDFPAEANITAGQPLQVQDDKRIIKNKNKQKMHIYVKAKRAHEDYLPLF